MKFVPDTSTYPFDDPSYVAGFDDGTRCQQTLTAPSNSWRLEKYAASSNVLVIDQYESHPAEARYCDDGKISELLEAEEQPKVRFIVLEPTAQYEFLRSVKKDLTNLYWDNFLGGDWQNDMLPFPIQSKTNSEMNITQETLLKILSKYHVAPDAASHIRGQEQTFGSRLSFSKSGEVSGLEFWYAIRARAFIRPRMTKADLRMTVVTHFNTQTGKSLVLLKYRSLNVLPVKLQVEVTDKLKEIATHPDTSSLADNPFTLTLFHIKSTTQFYGNAARVLRHSINRLQRVLVHDNPEGINPRALHLTVANIDKDSIQLQSIIAIISRLRKHHDLFYRLVKDSRDPDGRDNLYFRVEGELDLLEDQVSHIKRSMEDIKRRGERLIDLKNAMSTSRMAKHAMLESASMSTISIVTMIFLPGTFVATIFGTNFVVGPDRPSSSNTKIFFSSQWWILPAVTVPLTLMTLYCWWAWRRFKNRKIRTTVDAE
ncbi:hypothetical protein HDK90DRAFT_409253 [Phyllosticta capitalensis]|uniref:Uncharacterized protein n=1 Tax=Phyllosticta capitalensis TaxID=121624 RepID=A0ABR1YXH4_9PEZI